MMFCSVTWFDLGPEAARVSPRAFCASLRVMGWSWRAAWPWIVVNAPSSSRALESIFEAM